MGMTTRFDKALEVAAEELFLPWNGRRKDVLKVIVLVTDGTQSPDEDSEDPANISAYLR